MNNTIKIFSYQVFCSELSTIRANRQVVINTLNGHSYNVAKIDTEFKSALLGSDILLPDGISITFAARVLKGKKINKIAGYDLFLFYVQNINQAHGSVFFLGASEHTLGLITSRLQQEYPHIKVASYSPPYKESFSAEESKAMCEAVNHFKPDVLFVGMTAPKQEKWVHAHKHALEAKVICSIGAVFDFYSGTTHRPPAWLIHLKLEWLGRLLSEPKRMWYRYLVSTPVIYIDIIKLKCKRNRKSA
jgi:N-acetylglucosaminyldiphosphoundecaprenol N-acetyl-beta-D-mannosaminyltransferase